MFAHQMVLLGDLLKYGKQIVIKGKDYVNNPENKFQATVLGAVAHRTLPSKTISKFPLRERNSVNFRAFTLAVEKA